MKKKYIISIIAFLVVFGFIIIFLKYRNDINISSKKSAVTINMAQVLQQDQLMPIVIIGSGCAGLSAAVYGARSSIKTLVISGRKPGGQLVETSYVENWPGSEKILGLEVIDNLKKQAVHFGATVLDDAVTNLDCSEWPYTITTEENGIIKALSIIIATGATPRRLGVIGDDHYWGKGVTTCAICDAAFHKNQDVVVVGGGDSAAEQALQLAPYAKTVTIIVRSDSMRASARMQERIAEVSNIALMYDAQIQEIVGDGNQVTAVTILATKTKQIIKKPVTGVFLAIGHDPNSTLVQPWVATDIHGYITMKERTQETSLSGIFAAGDVEDFQYRQAGVAAGSGIKAALDAVAFLQEQGFNPSIAHAMEPLYFEPIALQKGTVLETNSLPDLEALLNKNEMVLVDFYTPMCPSCIQMMPAMEIMAHKFANKIVFTKVDASVAKDCARHFNITMVPVVLLFKNGSLIAQHNQAMSKKELYEFITKYTG